MDRGRVRARARALARTMPMNSPMSSSVEPSASWLTKSSARMPMVELKSRLPSPIVSLASGMSGVPPLTLLTRSPMPGFGLLAACASFHRA